MAFGLGSSPFTPQQQSSVSFLNPQQQQLLLQQQQQQQQQIHLLTKEKTPVTYHTKWADLHPESQNLLLQVETRILEYRDESRRLDQCERLFNSLALNEGFEADAAQISQELGQITTAMDREKISLQELMKNAKEMMRNAEVAVRSFMMLRSRFVRTVAPVTVSSNTLALVPSSGTGTPGITQAVASSLPIVDFYSGVPTKPSAFLQQTVHRFEHELQEYRQWIEELERLLFVGSEENEKDNHRLSLVQSLPAVMMNIHDFLIYVAAKVETLHQQIGSLRVAYLAHQKRRGDDNNPFLEADRREIAKREAAARRVHPTLQPSTASQPMTQPVGLLTSVTPATASNPQSSVLSGTSPFPAFGTSSPSSTSSTILGTPSTTVPTLNLFGSSSTSGSSIFGSSGASTAPSLSGPGTSPSIFGSVPASGSSSLFSSTFAGASGASTLPGLFGTTSASSGGLFGSSVSPSGGIFGGGQTAGNLFGTPAQPLGGTSILGTGAAAFGIGTAQGANTSKPKPRTARRK